MPPTYLVRLTNGKLHGRVCRTCGVLLTRTNAFSLRSEFCRQHDPDHESRSDARSGAGPRRKRSRAD